MTEAGFDVQTVPPVVTNPTRPFYWSVRREIWENRSLYLAPLIIAAFVLLMSLATAMHLPNRIRVATDPVKRTAMILKPYHFAPSPIMLTTFLVGMFYSLDALYGERRDRSVLFWKSLPVSDLTTVLSKMTIPLVVLPLIAFGLSSVTLFIMLLQGTTLLVVKGMNPAILWSELSFFHQPVVMAYGLAVHALWFAPIYGWLLLISAWAKRTPLLWAVLPAIVIGMVEKMAFNTTYVSALIRYRVVGAMERAFHVIDPRPGSVPRINTNVLEPWRFLSTPGLWGGLIFAAICIAVAVWLRRNREPI